MTCFLLVEFICVKIDFKFSATNKMDELVEDEILVEITIPEAQLDEAEMQKLDSIL